MNQRRGEWGSGMDGEAATHTPSLLTVAWVSAFVFTLVYMLVVIIGIFVGSGSPGHPDDFRKRCIDRNGTITEVQGDKRGSIRLRCEGLKE